VRYVGRDPVSIYGIRQTKSNRLSRPRTETVVFKVEMLDADCVWVGVDVGRHSVAINEIRQTISYRLSRPCTETMVFKVEMLDKDGLRVRVEMLEPIVEYADSRPTSTPWPDYHPE
jgi:hypothetical protein